MKKTNVYTKGTRSTYSRIIIREKGYRAKREKEFKEAVAKRENK